MPSVRLMAQTSVPAPATCSGTQTAAWIRPSCGVRLAHDRRVDTAAETASSSAVESGVIGDPADELELVDRHAQQVVGDPVTRG